MQKIVDLPNGRLLMVKLSGHIKKNSFEINFVNALRYIEFTAPYGKHPVSKAFKLPSGNWQLLGRPGEITEEKARTIVEGVGDFHSKLVGTYPESYWDYESNELLSGFTATKSLQSLITSNGFFPDETVLLFESPEIKEL